jgi:hypothetical protein
VKERQGYKLSQEIDRRINYSVDVLFKPDFELTPLPEITHQNESMYQVLLTKMHGDIPFLFNVLVKGIWICNSTFLYSWS